MEPAAEVTEFSLERVQKSLEENKPVRALGQLLLVVSLQPHLKNDLCSVVISVLDILSSSLAVERRYKDLLQCFQQVFEIYSDSEVVLNAIGSQLYRFNHLQEARAYFQRACLAKTTYLPAFRNLQNVTNVLVERWHFRMLNDRLRNEMYRAAIGKRVGEDLRTVIDIGTGTGLLSLYINEAGAQYICACDYSSVMINIARQVFDANIPSSRIHVVDKLSTDMKVPRDVPSRCSLVVTETMDSGLLGEHLLSTLDHAWDNLLLPPESARVIPASARLIAVPIESMKIAQKNSLIPNLRHSKTSAENEQLNFDNLVIRSRKHEPYDTENLFSDSNCRYLAEPVELFNFNFNDPKEVKFKSQNEIKKTLEIVSNDEGHLDAIAVWFEANLDDELTITTSPLSPDHCLSWHHAIFTCGSQKIKSGEKIEILGNCDKGVLTVATVNDTPKNVIYVEDYVLRFLNSSYLSALCSSMDRLLPKISSSTRIIDMNLFPYLGLLFAKKCSCRVQVVSELPTHLLRKVAQRNEIKSKLVTRKTFCDIENDEELAEGNKFDFLIANFIDTRGEISQDCLKTVDEITRKFLKPGGEIWPRKVEIWGQLIASSQLISENRVTDERINEDYALSDFLNEYQVSTRLDLNIHELNHQVLSDEFLICSLTTQQLNSRENLTWEIDVPCSGAGDLNAIVYWFKLEISEDLFYSTRSSDSYTSQAAEVLLEDSFVNASDHVTVKTWYNYGVIKLETTINR